MKKIGILVVVMIFLAGPVFAEDTDVVAEAPAQAMGDLYETEVAEMANEPGNQISELDSTVNPQITD